MILQKAKVAFSQLTGEGREVKGDKPNEYLIGLSMDKSGMKKFIADYMKIWDKEKPKKAKAEPKYPFSDLFSKSEETKGEYILWLSEAIDGGLEYMVADGDDYEMKHFTKLGAGSVVNVECNHFLWDNEYGKGMSIKLRAVTIREFVKSTGGKSPLESKGKSLSTDGTATKKSGKEEDKKEKKDKKKKKKSK